MRYYVVWLTDSVVIQTTTNNLLHHISRLGGWHSCLAFQKFSNPRRNPWDITPTLQTSHNHFLPPTGQPSARSTPSWDDINRLLILNKFPIGEGTRTHFTSYITAYNWSTSRNMWIQPTSQRLICIKSIVTSSYHRCLGLPRGLFPSAADKNFVLIYRLSFVLHTQPIKLIWSFCNASRRE